MTTLKLRKIGHSLGFLLPAEVAARLRLGEGDIVHLTDAPGGVRLTPYDPVFERQMDAARTVMRKRRNVLRQLAK